MSSTPIHLTRTERREMKRLGVLVDKATGSDRKFFERFPDREHRLRHAHSAEIAQEQILRGGTLAREPGCRFFIIVKNLCAGSRLRILIAGPEDNETDIGEAEAADIFDEFATPQIRMTEIELRAITCGGVSAS